MRQLKNNLFLNLISDVNGQPLAKAIETAKPHLPMLTYALDEIRQNDHLTEKQKKQQISLAIFKLVSSVRSRLDHDEQQSLDAFVDIYMQKISKELAEESVTSEVRSSQLIQNAVNQLEYALNDFVQTLEKEEKNEDLKTNSEETMSEDEDYEQVDFSFNFDDWNVNPFLRSKYL